MHIFALNCGSSSVKSALIDTSTRQRLFAARVENLGAPGADLQAAVAKVLQDLHEHGAPDAIAHRIVHGGERFVQATRIDDAVLEQIEKLSHLAPLHNPPALAAVRLARSAYPQTPHIAIFDTAFHATLPGHAREYALPADLRQRFGIRRYGFHGISHAHVMATVAVKLGADADQLRIVSCHLGNGASAAAIERGRSVDTSMGMTPLEGLVMGTRAGDLDPGILLDLLQSRDLDAAAVDEVLNKKSGLTGLAGTNDVREIERRATAGDERCRLALAIYSYRVRKYIGAYAAVMGGADAIAFTGGVGENSASIREACLQRLEFLGATVDARANRNVHLDDVSPCCEISQPGARTRILVVRADEELAMALETASATSSS
ncbi:MAG TPA: acetate/propionate family kinase [Steroidobacteraceae bacterium]|nr:acetate/propionate family kinase [Steroidobacteraceae bacterium]